MAINDERKDADKAVQKEPETNEERDLNLVKKTWDAQRDLVVSKYRFLYATQLMLLWFLCYECATNDDMQAAFVAPPASTNIVLARFLCAVFLHITLANEIKQGFAMMKFANNHWWLFRSWTGAYMVGFF